LDSNSIKKIVKLTSFIGLVLALFFLIPIVVGYIYNEDIKALAIFDGLYFLFNILILLFLRKSALQMSIKEAVLAVNAVWLLLGVVGGSALYVGSNISFASAFFEAISGFTTTGATIYTNLEILPNYLLMLRSLMHWIGGMGIIVLGVGLLSFINPTGSMAMFKSESTGISVEKMTPKIKDTAIRLWGIYLFLTILDATLLKIGGMSLFDAINHAFSTISTGGFSTKNSSMGYWENSYFILWITTIFMFLSGINFLAHLKFLQGEIDGYLSQEVKWYFYIFIFLSLSLALVHIYYDKSDFDSSMTHSFFTISSIITTTGFASTDYSKWSNFAVAFIFIPMFIGANAGSTAGGVKVIRYLVLFKNLIAQLKLIIYPNAVVNIFIDKNKIGSNIVSKVSAFFVLYMITVLLLSFYLFTRDYDFLTSFSASIAVIGNIGPGFGHVGPAENFSIFSDFDKIVLSIFMIIGRLEFFTFIIIFTKSFWKKF
jgi:trk system potassium uptake protein TrkH